MRVFWLLSFFFLLLPAPAAAQYHDYAPKKPSVEVDLGVLDELKAVPRNYDTRTHSTAPRAQAVTQAPLAQEPVPAARTRIILKPVPAAKPHPPAPETPEERITQPAPEYAPRIIEEQAPKSEAALEPGPEIKTEAASDLTLEEKVVSPPVQEKDEPATASAVPLLGDLTLEFSGGSSEIDPVLAAKLDNIADRMSGIIDGRLQVRAYASGEDGTTSSARRISLARALSVRSYLMDKGIKPTRVDVRALGSETDRSPVDRVDLIFVR